MNPLLNPKILFPLVKNYYFDPGRLKNSTSDEIKRYKDKAFRVIVKHAYKVPLYHEKYKKAGIHPSDIKGIKDLEKLPFVTKAEIKQNFPDKILPVNYNKKNAHVICTGGTTGKPVCIYTDFLSLGRSIGIHLREMNHLNIDGKNAKTVHIGNFNPYRVDMVSRDHFQPHVRFFMKQENNLNVDVSTPIPEMLDKLDSFKPDIIMSYPAILQHLAFLRRKGQGKNVSPKICWTGGAMLDEYTKKYVEDTFKTRLLNVYPSVEANGNMAFECYKGNWHVHDDFYHLEAMNDDGEILEPGARGHLVMTRLWGYATPIIRYTGMDDWVRISKDFKCDCGLCSSVVENGVEGRLRANIILPDGKVFPPGAFCFITPVLNRLKTFKVKRFQIVQKKVTEIEVLLVIDEDLRDIGPSVEKIMEEIKKIYQQKSGPKVTINVKEVDEIKPLEKGCLKPPPIVISKVSRNQGYDVLENA